MSPDLVEQNIEGIVITVPCKGAILKWKGCEDTDPRRIEAMLDLTEKSQNMEVMRPLNMVLQESLLFQAHGKKRYFDPNLIDAFNSGNDILTKKKYLNTAGLFIGAISTYGYFM